jgi:DNA uptake protein ComE-like DNA-binding protein
MKRTRRIRASGRRATVLFAVLFLVVAGALTASAVLESVSAERAAVVRELESLELRSGARSALAVYLEETASQRESLLEGAALELTDRVVIDRGENETAVVARLIPFADGSRVSPEAGRLGVNHAEAAALGAIPGITAGLGERIVETRRSSWFGSPLELLGLEGGAALSDGSGADEGPIGMLTVFAFEPEIRLGLGAGEEDFRGAPRVNLNGPWSDAMERALAQSMGAETAKLASQLFIDAPRFERAGDLVRAFTRGSVPREVWATLLDALTTNPDPFRGGVVDINRAPVEVLAALPGVGETRAPEMISARDRLDERARARITWPLEEGILDEEAFASLVDVAVTRSLQWRVRFEVSFEQAASAEGSAWEDGESFGLPGADEFGVEIERDAAARGMRLVYECVLDAADPRVRVAYLRERTGLDLALDLARLGVLSVPGGAPGDEQPTEDQTEPVPDDESEIASGDPIPGADPAPLDLSPGQETPETGDGPAGADRRVGRWAPTRRGGG